MAINPLLSKDVSFNRNIHFFLSHTHWDHIQGFPFFSPAFVPDAVKVTFHGRASHKEYLSKVLVGQQEYINFPIAFDEMPCEKEYSPLGRFARMDVQLGTSEVNYAELSHPGSVYAYKISNNGKTFICATDTEHRDNLDPRLINLAKNGDILYYDAQYTPNEYLGEFEKFTDLKIPGICHYDWGHSTYEWGIKTALAANVKTIVLGHHDPLHSDFVLDEIYQRAMGYLASSLKQPENQDKSLNLVMGYDGMELKL